jgi:hypothetical protein
MKAILPDAFTRHGQAPCLNDPEARDALREGSFTVTHSDSPAPATHVLKIYQRRLQHLSRFKSSHGRKLHGEVSVLCAAVERQPPEVIVTMSEITFGRGRMVCLVERADTGEFLCCLTAIDRRRVSEAEWTALWNDEAG